MNAGMGSDFWDGMTAFRTQKEHKFQGPEGGILPLPNSCVEVLGLNGTGFGDKVLKEVIKFNEALPWGSGASDLTAALCSEKRQRQHNPPAVGMCAPHKTT